MNETTETTGTPKLNAALAKAQGMLEGATKDSKNPAFLRDGKPSTYADLASVLACIRDAFAACEIAYPQTTSNNAEGVTVTTHLRHSSGESLSSAFWVPVVQKTPQGYGSATTYARRFGLMAIAGVAAEDDDGNSHSSKPDVRAESKKPVAPKPVDSSKIAAAFAGLGVTVAQLEDRIGKPLSEATEEDAKGLREYLKKKKELAAETPDQLAAKLAAAEAEKAEAGIRAEAEAKARAPSDAETKAARAAIDAQLGKLAEVVPPLTKEQQRNAAFTATTKRIADAPTEQDATLIASQAAAEVLFGKGELTALARAVENRVLILRDKVRRKLVIDDKTESVPF